MKRLHVCFIVAVVGGCTTHSDNAVPDSPIISSPTPTSGSAAKEWPFRPQNFSDDVGCRLWEYCIPYQQDVQQALDDLRQREFKAGRYYRSELNPATINDAIRNADAPGTRSVLDISKVAPRREIETISPAPTAELRRLFDTDKPTREQVERASRDYTNDFASFLETYDRDEGVFIVLYKDGEPSEIYIAGWSSG